MLTSSVIADAYTLTDHTVPVDGGEITVRCLIPIVDDEEEKFPVLVNLHGGGMSSLVKFASCERLGRKLTVVGTASFPGWSVGSTEMDDCVLRIRCVKYKLSIVNVEYR